MKEIKMKERMVNMLISDKHFELNSLKSVLKNDLYYLLNNYFLISPNDVEICLDVDEKGDYIFDCKIITSRLKKFGTNLS